MRFFFLVRLCQANRRLAPTVKIAELDTCITDSPGLHTIFVDSLEEVGVHYGLE